MADRQKPEARGWHALPLSERLAMRTVRDDADYPADELGRLTPSRSDLALIEWRRAGCRCLLLSVYLTPAGWYLYGEDYRIPPDEWLRRAGLVGADGVAVEAHGGPVTMERHQSGEAKVIGLRKVTGLARLLPLDPSGWRAGVHFEVGCDHGHGDALLSDVADDAAQVRRQSGRVERTVALDVE